jgi:hypothetical protein
MGRKGIGVEVRQDGAQDSVQAAQGVHVQVARMAHVKSTVPRFLDNLLVTDTPGLVGPSLDAIRGFG